jgi:hypothetical protein
VLLILGQGVIVGGTLCYYRIYLAQGDLGLAAQYAYLAYVNLGVFFGVLAVCEVVH